MKLFKIALLTSLFFYSIIASGQSQYNLSLLGALDYDMEGNDIWGYVDSNGEEYAIVGLVDGVSFVDLSNPQAPAELFFVSGQNSIWRDIKVWKNYAYVTSDNTTEGLLIIDLDDLSGNTYTYTTVDNNGEFMFLEGHNIFIDEFGKAYIFGGDVSGNSATAGALILDVTSTSLLENNEVLPTILGIFDDFYFHDGMVRGDTLWGSAVNEGNFYAVDVSDPANPEIFNNGLAFHETPSSFTHNCWISDDGNYLFTTDEVSGGFIASYDVSDLSNIQEIDYIQSSPEDGTVIPHNTHFNGNFLITSYYRDGTVVHDATYPAHLIEVAHYDSYSGGGNGFDGSWGVYPFLPSGLIITSEINSSLTNNAQLLVLEPTYSQACYLSGIVSNYVSGQPLIASVAILNIDQDIENTNLSGSYFSYTLESGTYEVVYSAENYFPDTITLEMQNGVMIEKDIALIPLSAIFGCTDTQACNFDQTAEVIDNSCEYINGICETCEEGIIINNDLDNDGVCDQDEISGCTDNSACNYNEYATEEDNSCEYLNGICETCEDGVIIDNDFDNNGICDQDEISYDCQNNSCIDPLNGSGTYSNIEECQEVCQTTSIKEINHQDIVVFPNPFNSQTTVTFSNSNNEYLNLRIVDIRGQTLQNYSIKNKEAQIINKGELAKGMYYIQLRGNQNWATKPIVLF